MVYVGNANIYFKPQTNIKPTKQQNEFTTKLLPHEIKETPLESNIDINDHTVN